MILVTLKIYHLITNKTNLIKYILFLSIKLGCLYKHEIPTFWKHYDKTIYMIEHKIFKEGEHMSKYHNEIGKMDQWIKGLAMEVEDLS